MPKKKIGYHGDMSILNSFFRDRTTCQDEDLTAGQYALRVLRTIALGALCLLLVATFNVINHARHERVDPATFNDPKPSGLFIESKRVNGRLTAENPTPDETLELTEILRNGKPLGTFAHLWQRFHPATPKTAYTLSSFRSSSKYHLKFDAEGRALNAHFSKEDTERLARIIKAVAER